MTQRSKTYAKLVAAIVIVLVLAGCASEPSLATGTYTTSITREDTSSYIFIGIFANTMGMRTFQCADHCGTVTGIGMAIASGVANCFNCVPISPPTS